MKVAIVGTAPSSRMQAPIDNTDWQIWACSPGIAPDFSTFCDLPRLDSWFEIHRMDEPTLVERLSPEGVERYKEWMATIARQGVNVITQEPIEHAEQYPVKEIVDRWGRYYTNTISYMISYAIRSGATDIMLAGVDMAAIDEYGSQRPSCEYHLGIAVGLGINVTIPLASDLLKCRRMYGFDPEDGYSAKCAARSAELSARVNQAKHEMELYAREQAGALSALEEIDAVKKLLNGELTTSLNSALEERQGHLANNARQAAQECQQRKDTITALMGAEEDTKYWSQWR